MVIKGGLTGNTHHTVALLQSCLGGSGTADKVLDDKRHLRLHRVLGLLAVDILADTATQREADEGVVTQHGDVLRVAEDQLADGAVDTVIVTSIDGIKDVAVVEALFLQHLMVMIAVGGIAQRQLVLAPGEENHGIE